MSLIGKISTLTALLLMFCLPVCVAQKKTRRPAADPNLLAAESYLRQRNYAKAVEALELVISVEPRSDERIYSLLATTHLQAGDFGKALAVCQQALAVHPASRRLEDLYLTVLPLAVPPAEAKARLNERLKVSDSPILRKALGQILLKENPTDSQAGTLLSGVARALPRDAEAHYLYGQWACLNNQKDLCLLELNKALVLAPTNDLARMQIYTMIGIAEAEVNRSEQAGAAFAKAFEYNQKLASPNPQAAMQYVKFLLDHSRAGEVRGVVDKILQWSPTFGPALLERAKLLVKDGKLEEAVSEGEKALQNSTGDQANSRAAHAFLAKTYFALGREDKAQEHQSWIEAPR